MDLSEALQGPDDLPLPTTVSADRTSPSLSPADLAVVREAAREINDAPPPRDYAPVGCALAIPGFVILFVTPVLGRRFGLGGSVATVALVAGIALLALGLIVYYAAGGLVRGHAIAAAEAAVRRLEEWDPEEGDRGEALRASTLLLLNAYAVYGPTTAGSFDRDEARERLGPMIRLVEAVEGVLVEEEGIYRVFTEAEPDEDQEEENP